LIKKQLEKENSTVEEQSKTKEGTITEERWREHFSIEEGGIEFKKAPMNLTIRQDTKKKRQRRTITG
jgi:hypothetical protein